MLFLLCYVALRLRSYLAISLSKVVSGIYSWRYQAFSCLFQSFSMSHYHKLELTWPCRLFSNFTLVWIEKLEELQIFLSLLNWAFALPSLLVISLLHPPFDITTPPRYVKVSTSSMVSLSILTCSLILEPSLITLVFLMLPIIFRPTPLAFSCSDCVFRCISRNLEESKARSSAKSRSSSLVVKFHLIPVGSPSTELLMTTPITKRSLYLLLKIFFTRSDLLLVICCLRCLLFQPVSINLYLSRVSVLSPSRQVPVCCLLSQYILYSCYPRCLPHCPKKKSLLSAK